MLQEERYLKIVTYLKENGQATLGRLSEETGVSVGTIRRDLEILEKSGMIQTVRGGAIAKNDDLSKQRFNMRNIEHKNEKQLLAEALKDIVVDGQSVALNGGTTNIAVAQYLVSHYQHLTIITNNLYLFRVLKNAKNFTLIVPGGLFDHEEYAIYGKQCERDFLSYNIDVALLAVNAISLEKGVTDFRWREVGVIRSLIKSAKRKIIVADYSKFDRIACANVCGLEEIDYIVSDSRVTEETVRKYYEKAHVGVIRPRMDNT
ncbi:transcriptional regulator, DeoR family [Oscillibacter sp. PC13]|uniref:DeoR/GlpR family DNA-binding transcription regulator n=1 Tax=Oscillibacter sp. PC13 TaxID=1855299 RepID=UPI0008E4C556|nr:DeoR/GlpR family DNA-binding transcription regulator [Oscillibacter sp. PC13]SFP87876.1 transcriptional regulator, DeoR family [Oscillibacter sp. PC13]